MKKNEDKIRNKYQRMGYKVYQNGWPDFLVEKDGKFFCVEVKHSGYGGSGAEQLSESQFEMQDALHRAGLPTTIEYTGYTYVKETDEQREKRLLENAQSGENSKHTPARKKT